MLQYSRKSLISSRGWWKSFKFIQARNNSLQINSSTWAHVRSLGLLARTRGTRGGKDRSLSQSRSISVVAGRPRVIFQSSSCANLSNLLNIQAGKCMTCVQSTEPNNKESVTGTNNSAEKSHQTSKVRIAHLNVRSLKNRDHLIQLRQFVHDNDYDIFGISESWLNSTVKNAEVEIEGYKISRLDRQKKVGGGVCVYTRTSLKTKVIKELTGTSASGFHQLWLKVQHKKLRSIMLCVTYRPPDCPVTCFVDDFMDNYTQALTLGKEVFVVGDLNCNLLKSCPEADALRDLCTSLNLTQLVTSPTRVTPHSSSLIDVIMTSNTTLVVESGVVETHISDHYLTYSLLNLKLPKPPPNYVIARSYKRYNPDSFVADLAQVPWLENALIDDVSEKVDHFNTNFLQVLNRHAPIKTVKIRHRHCPFVDKEIKDIMVNRDQLLKIAKQTRMLEDWRNYRTSRENVKIRLREAEREHVQIELQHCKKNSSMWKVIRSCIPRKEIFQPLYSRDLKEITEEFNAFFVSVGNRASETSSSLAAEYNLPTPSTPPVAQVILESDKFQFHAVSCEEIRKTVMSFPSNKAPGYDKISMSVIKDALPCILFTLTDMVNRSLMSSVFPTAWKTSEVIPLLKDGDHEVANNNRPVSLLPVASKICERIALNQYTSYMKKNKRLTEHQSGNRQSHSTETLNIMMSDKILEAMDSRKLMVVVLLDLSKAFDSIDHRRLLVKLQALGVSRTALEWFRSYLSERKQYVRIGCEVSGTTRMSAHGVPQGSILGPALFNAYINDLPAVPEAGFLESYVDDSKLYLSFPVNDAAAVALQITDDLKRIAAWCCHNSLLINPDKTKLLLLGTRQMLQRVPTGFLVTLLGKELLPVPSVRDLGIQVDATLSYDEHITNTVSACIASLSQISRVKYVFDTRTLLNIINALVFSKLYYCSSVWSNTSKKNVRKLQNVQNFAARIVSGTRKFDHVTPVLKELNWLPVSQMLLFRDGVLAFKCVKGLSPSYLSDRFTIRSMVHTRNTRNKDKLNIPAYKSAAGQRSFLYRAVSLWNSLPCDLTDSTNIVIFKKDFRNYLLEQFLST